MKRCYIKSIVASIGLAYLLDVSTIGLGQLVLLGILFWFFLDDLVVEKRLLYCASGCALLFSIFSVLVKVENYFLTELVIVGIFKTIVCLLGGFWIYQRCLIKIYIWFEQNEIRFFCDKPNKKNKKIFVGIWGSVLLVWLPYYLAYYPAIMSFDSMEQAKQILGVSQYSNHHPMLHTLILKLLYSTAKIFVTTETAAFGFVAAVQMVLLATVFSLIIYWGYTHLLKKKILILVWAFYAILPYQGLYSITLWKDIWFAGVVGIFVLILFTYFYEYPPKLSLRMWLYILVVLFGCAVCLMRSNGYYAFLLFIIVCILDYKRCKNLIWLLTIAFIMATLIKGPVYNRFDVVQGDIVEELSIPIQNISFVITEGKELTTEEYELLRKVVDVEKVPEYYKKDISDPIKLMIRYEDNLEYLEENKIEYLKLWIKLGMKYPMLYLISWVNQTSGYWHPDFTEKGYFTLLIDNEMNIERKSKIYEDGITKWANEVIEIPVIGSLFSMGIYAWILLLMSFYLIYKRRWDRIVMYSLPFGIWFTLLIAVPTAYSFRYFYAVVVTVPLLIMMSFVKQE